MKSPVQQDFFLFREADILITNELQLKQVHGVKNIIQIK